MAKLTKAQRKAHAEAEAILTKDRLTEDEREFVFRNWHEGAEFINGAAGAFFTPYDLAGDFALDGAGGRVIDLCAGIGILSYFVGQRARYGSRATELTCVEINPKYCEVGRKLVPEARWINADVFDWKKLDLGRYDIAIGNPPFGRVRRSANGPRYRGSEFEYHVIDIAAELADYGVGSGMGRNDTLSARQAASALRIGHSGTSSPEHCEIIVTSTASMRWRSAILARTSARCGSVRRCTSAQVWLLQSTR